MENDVAEHFHWSINQEANFWFEDQNGQTSRLATDQQLIALLWASKLVKFIMTIDRCEHGQNMTQMEDQSLLKFIQEDFQKVQEGWYIKQHYFSGSSSINPLHYLSL